MVLHRPEQRFDVRVIVTGSRPAVRDCYFQVFQERHQRHPFIGWPLSACSAFRLLRRPFRIRSNSARLCVSLSSACTAQPTMDLRCPMCTPDPILSPVVPAASGGNGARAVRSCGAAGPFPPGLRPEKQSITGLAFESFSRSAQERLAHPATPNSTTVSVALSQPFSRKSSATPSAILRMAKRTCSS